MKLLVLYTEIAGYTLACLRRYLEVYGGEIHLVRWPVHPDAPFRIDDIPGLIQYERRSMNRQDLLDLAARIQPSGVFVAGWVDKDYFHVVKTLRRQGIPVACGMDNQWRGDFRQKLATLLAPFYLFKGFSHIWAAGMYQFEYARRLGFPRERILTGLYAADTRLFEAVAAEKLGAGGAWPRELLFVGRMVDDKGVRELADAFVDLQGAEGKGWTLRMIGNGALRESLPKHPAIQIQGFVQPHELPALARSAGAFVLPSRFEPWGVVLHEFAAAGLPLIASDQCGAATAYLRPGYNGYSHVGGDRSSLREALRALFQASDAELRTLGARSRELSRQYSPDTWAATFHTLITRP